MPRPQAWIFFALHLTAFAAAARSADDMRPEDRSAPPPGSAGRRFVVFGIRTGSKLSNCVWKFLTKYDTLNIERERPPACVASACLGKERERMKRRRRVLLLSLALCLLAGCASSADGSAEAAGGGSGLSAALLEEAARPLAEEEILAAYDRGAGGLRLVLSGDPAPPVRRPLPSADGSITGWTTPAWRRWRTCGPISVGHLPRS